MLRLAVQDYSQGQFYNDGMPQPLYNSAGTGQLDHYAIHELNIPAEELMQRAGQAVYEFADQFFAEAERWVVLCGPGNNAGDGYVVADLARQAGKEVTVVALRPVQELEGAARHWADRYCAGGGSVVAYDSPDSVPQAELVIDALLGTGLTEPLRAPYAELVDHINTKLLPVLAVDVPTGLSADTGQVMGSAVEADATLTFIAAKPGLYTADGPDHAGLVKLVDLEPGLRDRAPQQPDARRYCSDDLHGRLPIRPQNSHKGDFGHVWIVGGGPGMSGAVLLAGLGALRAGAGKVSIATHPDHAGELLGFHPELMIHPVGDGDTLAKLVRGADVLVIGPGLGQDDWSMALLQAGLEQNIPLVLDADGLNLLCEIENVNLPPGSVLTPHPGEAARLLGQASDDVQQDRLSAAAALVHACQATVILKGCGSVVAAVDAIPALIDAGHPAMATGGMGDILSGVVAAVLADRTEGGHVDSHEAAITAALWHAVAGAYTAAQIGPAGILASEVADGLPAVRHEADQSIPGHEI